MKLIDAQRALGIAADGRWGPQSATAIAAQIREDSAFLRVKLSESFELREMLVSATGSRRGISNLPDGSQLLQLAHLCKKILQPVRDHYGRAVIVTSGLRVPRLNRAVGGSRTSQHCYGQAADFTVSGESNFAVAKWIATNTPYDQLIYEFGESGWIHCSYGPRNRRQRLSAVKRWGRTKYLSGLVA